jgi:hypothetical protein
MSVSGISSNTNLCQTHHTHMQHSKGSSSAGEPSTTTTDDSNGSSNVMATDLGTLLQALGSHDQSDISSLLSQLQPKLQTVGAADGTGRLTASSSATSRGTNPLAHDLGKLEEALQSGDLTSAQNVFSQIMQRMQPPPPPDTGAPGNVSTSAMASTGSANTMNTLASDLGALGTALQSGDLTSAQSSFSQLLDDLKATGSDNGTNHDRNPLADDLNKLEAALQSGDLTSAQNVFSQIMQHMPPPPPDAGASGNVNTPAVTSTGSTSATNTLASDFDTLGAALQSGDLTGAQSSFAQLLEDLQATGSTDGSGSSTASSHQDLFSLDQLLKIWTTLTATTANNSSSTINVSA